MTTLSARDGYRLWATHYEAETAVSYLENELIASLGVPTIGVKLLDVGCGTGRRLRDADAALAVGVDASPEMLHHGSSLNSESLGQALRAVADVRAIPIVEETFDVVWCRLMIGHINALEAAYAELSRVCRFGGVVIVTDLSTSAVAAGHRRTFRDADGATREVEHFVHSIEAQNAAARNAGLAIVLRTEAVVGPSIKSFYEDAGRMSAYESQRGLPLVSAQLMRKMVA
ncbi:MAG: class I SAM-dependent methyltransferase [bacterium]